MAALFSLLHGFLVLDAGTLFFIELWVFAFSDFSVHYFEATETSQCTVFSLLCHCLIPETQAS
jgi:hypothetical protein